MYTRLSWIIVFIHIIIYLYLGLFSISKNIASGYIVSLIILGLAFLLRSFLQKKKAKLQLNVDSFFFLLMIAWVSNQQYLLAIIPGVFFILSGIALRTLIVRFSEERINYPSFQFSHIEWKDVENSMIKDGLLTIDLKNNRLIQEMIDEDRTPVNEKEFNEFCKKQLTTDQ